MKVKTENRATIGDEEGGLYSFDDIDVGQRVAYRGTIGYVVEKGDHVMPQTSARHLEVWVNKDRDNRYLHENLVNKWLRKGKTLWVDWTWIGNEAMDAE